MNNQRALRPFIWVPFCLSLVILLAAGSLVTPVAAQDANALHLPVVKTGGSSQQPPPGDGGPWSEALIDEAHQAGELDDATALLYRVYASFGDARLPEEYRAEKEDDAPSLALYQAQVQMATLPPAIQAELASFVLPPMDPNSWIEQRAAAEGLQAQSASGTAQANAANRITWSTACQTDPNIKVWYQQRYPEDADDARQLCELVSGTIWPRLRSLFGAPPRSDSGQPNNGGDGQLDFYLVTANTGAVRYVGCEGTPSYILVNNKKWSAATVTQAMMSAYVDGYEQADCGEYMWLYAASLPWAIDYVFPEDNTEQSYADDFLNHTDISLNYDLLAPLAGADSSFESGAYLWLWFATNFVGDAKTIIPAIWQNATNADSLEVMNNALGNGGFEDQWARFSEMNWNNEPVATYFMTDKLIHSTKPQLEADVALNGQQDRTYELDGKVDYLAAHTFHFTFDDPTVRSVLFVNPFHGNEWPTARVKALYRLADGTWKLEEWTGERSKGFCRDLQAERVVDLTVIISNHEFQDRTHQLKPEYPPRLNATNVACRGWEFAGTATYTGQGEFGDTFSEETTVNAVYTRDTSGDNNSGAPITSYRVSEGSGSWTHQGSTGFCNADDSGTFELTGGVQTILFVFTNATDLETGTKYMPEDRPYHGFGSEGLPVLDTLKATYVCGDGSTSERMVFSAARWFETETVPTQQVDGSGVVITGSFTIVDNTSGTSTRTYEWTMTALPPE